MNEALRDLYVRRVIQLIIFLARNQEHFMAYRSRLLDEILLSALTVVIIVVFEDARGGFWENEKMVCESLSVDSQKLIELTIFLVYDGTLRELTCFLLSQAR